MTRIYTLSIDPAKRTPYGYEIRFAIACGKDPHRFKIAAQNLDELEAVVKERAKEYGKGCAASVHVADGGRKPKGFDNRFRGLFFNLDEMEVAEQ